MDANSVLEIFKEITAIPRESGHEGPMTAYLQRFAAAHSLECKTDETGNVLIVKEASKGKENVPALVLQGHQDMVCEKKPGTVHDFARDPIDFVIEDGWMIAKDTTLGADDGIGVAACLALLASDLETGRLECLFTISEETGMDGAHALQDGFFTGKTLINLDSEDEGQMFIGCAGGLNTIATFDCGTEAVNDGWSVIRLSIGGALGGHSGDDINKGRVNTIQQMFRFLYCETATGLQLIEADGGNKVNAIARDCTVVIAVPDAEATKARFMDFWSILKDEYHVTDPDIIASSEDAEAGAAAGSDAAMRFISAMYACPHGVQEMSQDIAGLVETSTNLGNVKMAGPGVFRVATGQRSSTMSERKMIADKVEAVMRLGGARVEQLYHYPGWKPDVNSHILQVCVDSYEKLFGHKPLVLAIHAGLECGLFLDKFPDLDMISFGPTLRGVHAPGEKLELASLDKFVKHLEDVVCNFR